MTGQNAQTAQTAATPRSNPYFKVAVSRPYGEKNEQGHRKSLVTAVGRAFPHSNGVGLNVTLDMTPVMAANTRLVIFAGGKGERFSEEAAQRLAAFDVVEYTTKSGETKKRWNRIGNAFLSANSGAYELSLAALPTTGKIVLIVPQAKTDSAAQVEGDNAEVAEEDRLSGLHDRC